jgi:hypothetical protein
VKKSKIFIIVVIFLLIVVAAAIFFVGGISSVYDPIKKYEYHGSVEQLIQKINSYTSINHDILFEVEDTVGDIKNGLAFHYTVVIRANGNTSNYDLKVEEIDKVDHNKSEISLVGAHDPTNKLGGYRPGDQGIKQLINIFENNFIRGLNNSQNMDIKAIPDN